MRPYTAIIVFVALVASAALTGFNSYCSATGMIRSELNNAMAKAVAEGIEGWITPDTIRAYRQLQGATNSDMAMVVADETFARNISIPQLRGDSFITFDIVGGSKDTKGMTAEAHICSDTLLYMPESMRGENVAVALRGCAKCSFATVFSLSDQRMSLLLSLIAMLWAAGSVMYYRRKGAVVDDGSVITVGDVSFNLEEKMFYNSRHEALRFTPMQQQLMEMFFCDERHKLLKADICNRLWPKKEDASETLYTLIKRLKNVVESNSCLRIEVERGKAYKLL